MLVTENPSNWYIPIYICIKVIKLLNRKPNVHFTKKLQKDLEIVVGGAVSQPLFIVIYKIHVSFCIYIKRQRSKNLFT